MHSASNGQGGQSLEAEANSGTSLCVPARSTTNIRYNICKCQKYMDK
jgi:hypothetical protein